jgi:hypothetical protein
MHAFRHHGYVYRPARVAVREAARDRDGIPLPKSFVPHTRNFYHGTSNPEAARKILRDCELRPTVIAGRQSGMQAMKGRVYLTDTIEYALNYATEGTEDGYLFEVRRRDLQDVMLDEDFVGELICNAQSKWLNSFHGIRKISKKCSVAEPKKNLWICLALVLIRTSPIWENLFSSTSKMTKTR